MREVNHACDAFEQAWSSTTDKSTVPSAGSYLTDLPCAAVDSPLLLRRALLEQLLPKDLSERVRSGLAADREFYASRLPPEMDVVLDEISWPDSHASVPLGVLSRYQLRNEVGRGGMGVVYRARQIEGVQRDVALKVLDMRSANRDSMRRFEFEGQTLAALEHDRIAKVFDTGITEDGRAFLAMEFVDGQSLTQYCESQRLDVRGRLKLLLEVCRGVQHAHQRGVIHRDLKPANVLVRSATDGPEVKIIDFGLARAIGTGRDWTEVGHLLGTLEYLSPEQASLDPSHVDTRTDVYALGVILYELLTGSTPLRRADFSDGDYPRILDAIRRADHVPPSRRVRIEDSLEQASPADAISCLASKEVRCVSVELDWIVARALEKEPSRRYASVGDLAQDLERYLDDRPVEAGPPSLVYRFRKLVRRHWKASLVLAATLLTVVSFTVTVTLWFAEVNAQNSVLEKLNSELADSNRRLVATNGKLDSARSLAQDKARAANEAQQTAEANAVVAKAKTKVAFDILSSIVKNLQEGLRETPGSATLRSELLRTTLEHLDGVADSFLPQVEAEEVHVVLLKNIGELLTEFERRGREETITGDGQLLAGDEARLTPSEERLMILSLKFTDRAIALEESRAAEPSPDVQRTTALADLYVSSATALTSLRRFDEARQRLMRGGDALEQELLRRGFDDRLSQKLALLTKKMADVAAYEGRPRESIRLLELCLDRLGSCTEDAQSSNDGLVASVAVHQALSDSYQMRYDLPHSLDHRLTSIRLLSELESRYDQRLDRQQASAHLGAGWTLFRLKRFESGREHFEAAIRRLDVVAQADPENSHIQLTLWVAHSSLGQYYTLRGFSFPEQDPGQLSREECQTAVERHFSRMVDAMDRLRELRPQDRTTRRVCGISNGLLADLYARKGEHEKAVEFFGYACELSEAHLTDAAPSVHVLVHLADMHTSRARSLKAVGRHLEAKAALHEAREHIGRASSIAAQRDLPNAGLLNAARIIDDESADLEDRKSAP